MAVPQQFLILSSDILFIRCKKSRPMQDGEQRRPFLKIYGDKLIRKDSRRNIHTGGRRLPRNWLGPPISRIYSEIYSENILSSEIHTEVSSFLESALERF